MKNQSDTKEQMKRFQDAARKLGADESEEKFDAALKRVAKAKLTHPPRPKKASKTQPAD